MYQEISIPFAGPFSVLCLEVGIFALLLTLSVFPRVMRLGEQGRVWGAEAPDAQYTGCLPSH